MPTQFVAAERNYYQATANPAFSYPVLQGATTADVCVIGGGVSGCATALHLAQRGYRVVLLEAQSIGFGASGRSGGQLLPGYSSGQSPLTAQLGFELARDLWAMSVEAVQLTRQLIAEHHIECDLQQGHLDVAVTPRRARELHDYQQELQEQYQYPTQWLQRSALHDWLATDRYAAGLYDSQAPHVHPLNYTLGLAAAAARAGVIIHEHSQVLDYHGDTTVTINTAQGTVSAGQVVLCCNAYVDSLSRRLAHRIMPVGTYIVATEPLAAGRLATLMPHNVSVADTNFILDYFRRSADHRLLFGGRVSYSGRDFGNTAAATRKRMVQVFPQLHDVRIEYSWGGMLDITLNRAPDFGRLQPNVYYLQGFSGHGMALAGFAGKLVAETIAGHAERFDLYTRLQHRPFPGGALLRTPALVLAMLWYRLRDLL